MQEIIEGVCNHLDDCQSQYACKPLCYAQRCHLRVRFKNTPVARIQCVAPLPTHAPESDQSCACPTTCRANQLVG